MPWQGRAGQPILTSGSDATSFEMPPTKSTGGLEPPCQEFDVIRAMRALALASCLAGCTETPPPARTLPHGIVAEGSIVYTTTPLTVHQARECLRYPFPDTAAKIQYASYREGVAVNDVLRFEAPVADCLAAAQEIIDRHVRERPDLVNCATHGSTATLPTTSGPPGLPLSAPWFTPHQIQNGQAFGWHGSHCPTIYVDTDRGVLYYELSD